MEIWKDIPGYEGHYQASDFGRIKSIGRIAMAAKNGSAEMILKEKILCQQKRSSVKRDRPRYYIKLSKDGHKVLWLVHRLIALAFHENPLNLPQVNHIDGDQLNNRASNLEWCTALHNMQHAVENGLHHGPPGIAVIKFTKNWDFIKEYSSLTEASNDTGRKYQNISVAAKDETRTCGGFRWKFKNAI